MNRALVTYWARAITHARAHEGARVLGNAHNEVDTRINPESRGGDLSLLRSHRHLIDVVAPPETHGRIRIESASIVDLFAEPTGRPGDQRLCYAMLLQLVRSFNRFILESMKPYGTV